MNFLFTGKPALYLKSKRRPVVKCSLTDSCVLNDEFDPATSAKSNGKYGGIDLHTSSLVDGGLLEPWIFV